MGVCIFEIVMAWAVRDMPWWKVLLAAYVLAGTASQNLFTAQHELSHFLAFRKPLYNRILSIASNCPLVIPMATSFRKYHQEHHSHLVRHRPTKNILKVHVKNFSIVGDSQCLICLVLIRKTLQSLD